MLGLTLTLDESINENAREGWEMKKRPGAAEDGEHAEKKEGREEEEEKKEKRK